MKANLKHEPGVLLDCTGYKNFIKAALELSTTATWGVRVFHAEERRLVAFIPRATWPQFEKLKRKYGFEPNGYTAGPLVARRPR